MLREEHVKCGGHILIEQRKGHSQLVRLGEGAGP